MPIYCSDGAVIHDTMLIYQALYFYLWRSFQTSLLPVMVQALPLVVQRPPYPIKGSFEICFPCGTQLRCDGDLLTEALSVLKGKL